MRVLLFTAVYQSFERLSVVEVFGVMVSQSWDNKIARFCTFLHGAQCVFWIIWSLLFSQCFCENGKKTWISHGLFNREDMPEPGIKPGNANNILWWFMHQSVKGDTKGSSGWVRTWTIGEKVKCGFWWITTKTTPWCLDPIQSTWINTSAFNFTYMPLWIQALKSTREWVAMFEMWALKATDVISCTKKWNCVHPPFIEIAMKCCF